MKTRGHVMGYCVLLTGFFSRGILNLGGLGKDELEQKKYNYTRHRGLSAQAIVGISLGRLELLTCLLGTPFNKAVKYLAGISPAELLKSPFNSPKPRSYTGSYGDCNANVCVHNASLGYLKPNLLSFLQNAFQHALQRLHSHRLRYKQIHPAAESLLLRIHRRKTRQRYDASGFAPRPLLISPDGAGGGEAIHDGHRDVHENHVVEAWG
jgi:hypothetical protein